MVSFIRMQVKENGLAELYMESATTRTTPLLVAGWELQLGEHTGWG